jgi:predicted nucleotide-binding protein
MDNVVDDLVRIARKCERMGAAVEEGPIGQMTERLMDACVEIGKSWSGSCIGYHATVYLDGFRQPQGGEIFDREWGLGERYSRSIGHWVPIEYDIVKDAIFRRSGVSDHMPLVEAARKALATFNEAREELLPLFDAVLSGHDDNVIREQKEKLAKLPGFFSSQELGRDELPRGQYFSRDMLAMSQGLRPPHHALFRAWLFEQISCGRQVAEVAKISRHAARYMEHRLKMKGSSIAKTDGSIYIGHGRAMDWHQLKDFIHDRLKLEYEEFNREPVAGLTAKERLLAMLDKASFAFLVMTAEDEHADGKQHARENVIHEIGLFQGRLGFERAIILLEEGCEEFSNILGVQQIRFAKGHLKAKADDIRGVLEREKIIK